jgi:RNA polymerase sigma-70 factor, ECF subfamily
VESLQRTSEPKAVDVRQISVRQTSEYAVEIERVAVTRTKDNVLVGRAQRGDRDAFALLIEPRAGHLLHTARAILGDNWDAYEAAQETLIAAWVQLPTLRDADRVDAWLNRTLVNKCRDVLRKRKRGREIDLSGTDIAGPDTTAALIDEASVLAAFERLSVDDRHILVLHHLHDLPLAQIAVQLRIPVGTAKSRLWSARRALERALEEER